MRLGRRPSSGVLLATLALGCATAGRSRPLSDTLPTGIPAAAERARWERIDGDYLAGTDHVRYALFVDPERPLLFRITQYRVTSAEASRRPGGDDGPETVIWNETPGQRVPLRCFAEERRRDGRALGVGVRSSWRDVRPETLEFRLQMGRALEIYSHVRAEGRGGPPARP